MMVTMMKRMVEIMMRMTRSNEDDDGNEDEDCAVTKMMTIVMKISVR